MKPQEEQAVGGEPADETGRGCATAVLRSGPAADLAALHEALDAGALAAHAVLSGDEEAAVLALKRASAAAELAFPESSGEAAAMSVILAAIPVPAPGDWGARAACRSADPDLFFTTGREEEAKAVCAGCPVRAECQEHALSRPEEAGVWGGLTAAERLQLRGSGEVLECGACGQVKPAAGFAADGHGGYRKTCLACRAGQSRESRHRRKARHAPP